MVVISYLFPIYCSADWGPKLNGSRCEAKADSAVSPGVQVLPRSDMKCRNAQSVDTGARCLPGTPQQGRSKSHSPRRCGGDQRNQCSGSGSPSAADVPA